MLVLRPGALGDALLAVPAVRALRRAYGSITLATHAGAARLLASSGEIERGWAFDTPALTWLFTGEAHPDEQVVAWMTTTRPPGLRHPTLLAPSRPTTVQHCARYLLSTLTPLGIDLTWDDCPLAVSPARSEEILIHPGSGSMAKNWPPERFAAVIRLVNRPVRLIVGEADHDAAARVERSLGANLPRLDQPALETLADRLAGCRAYLGNDSGISHLAGLCGARTLALFGPSDPNVWRPIGPDIHVVAFDTPPEAVAELLV